MEYYNGSKLAGLQIEKSQTKNQDLPLCYEASADMYFASWVWFVGNLIAPFFPVYELDLSSLNRRTNFSC